MFTNLGNIALPLAVWLADDDYDLIPRKNMISATSLLKPMKSLVLSQRIAEMKIATVIELQDQIPSRLGTAIHAGVENAWRDGRWRKTMLSLGHPQSLIDQVHVYQDVMPDLNKIDFDAYNIFIEIRTERNIMGYSISGRLDFLQNGRVADVKSTKVYNWIKGGNDKKYAMQGSIYRWLNPKIILSDQMDVHYFFTDWEPFTAAKDKKYPNCKIMTRTLPLMPIPQVEHFIRTKIIKLESLLPLKEVDMPRCTPEEVWQQPTKYAYYKNPNKMARATKVFDSDFQATTRYGEDGSVGTVVTRPGKVKFCRYCPARPICQQAEGYTQQGLLAE